MTAFYLSQLSESGRRLYRIADRALGSRGMRGAVPPDTDMDALLTASRYVVLDRPEYWWTKGDFTAVPSADGRSAAIEWEDLCPRHPTEETDARIFPMIEGMRLDRYAAAADRVKALRDWMLRRVRYDPGETRERLKTAQTPFSVFIEGRCACMGIAGAVRMALEAYGMDCVIVLGTLFGSAETGHAWNLVRDGGRYRHVDITMSYPQFVKMRQDLCPGSGQECLMAEYGEIALSHRILPGPDYPE